MGESLPGTPKTPLLQRVKSSEAASTPPRQAGSTGSLPQTPCSPATLEHQKRSVSVQQAKLRVQVNEDKDSMDKAVQEQDFLKAAELKNSIAKAREEIERLGKVLDRWDPEELMQEIRKVSGTPARKRPADVSICSTPKQQSADNRAPSTPATTATTPK